MVEGVWGGEADLAPPFWLRVGVRCGGEASAAILIEGRQPLPLAGEVGSPGGHLG